MMDPHAFAAWKSVWKYNLVRCTDSLTLHLSDSLGWKQLEDRRKDLRLALLYKIVHGHVAVPVDALNLEPPDPRTRKKHKYMYKHLTPHTDPYFFCVALFRSGTLSLPSPSRLHLLSPSRLIWQAVPQRDQPWSGTPTHPRYTPEEDCGLQDQTRPDSLVCWSLIQIICRRAVMWHALKCTMNLHK